MKCKFCGAQIDKKMGICPECGLEVAPEDMKKNRKGLKIILAIVAGLVALALLAGVAGVALGALGIWNAKDAIFGEEDTKENNVFYKESYTVDEKTAKSKADVVIATAGDKKLDNGVFQFYYAMDVLDFLNNNSYYLSYLGLDYTLPLDEQLANSEENITWQQMFIDSALGDWYSYALMNLLAEESNYQISAETQQTIDTMAEQLEEVAISNGFINAQTMIDTDFGPGYDVADYLKYQEDRFRAVDYVTYLHQVLKPTAEEVEAYFTANEEALAESGIANNDMSYGNIRHILIQPQGGEEDADGYVVYSQEEWDACQKKAQEIMDLWLAGEATEDTFAQLANQYSEDPGSNTNGGLYTMVNEGEMVEEFDYWLFYMDHKYGDYGLIKTSYGYHLMYFVSTEETWRVDTETEMISAKIDEMLKTAEEKWPIEKSYKKIILNNLSLT